MLVLQPSTLFTVSPIGMGDFEAHVSVAGLYSSVE